MITIILATDNKGGIGKNGTIPWNHPEDLQHFKTETMDGTLIMGRKTFDSIGRRALKGRRTIVLSRGLEGFAQFGVEQASSLKAALALCEPEENVFIAGGAEVYNQAWPLADRIILTQIEHDYECDTFAPMLGVEGVGIGSFKKVSSRISTSEGVELKYATFKRITEDEYVEDFLHPKQEEKDPIQSLINKGTLKVNEEGVISGITLKSPPYEAPMTVKEPVWYSNNSNIGRIQIEAVWYVTPKLRFSSKTGKLQQLWLDHNNGQPPEWRDVPIE